MNEILEQVSLLMQYVQSNGGSLNSATQEAIANLLEQVLEFIEEQNPVEGLPPEIVPEIPASPFESSTVNGLKYDPKTQNLLVQFHGPYPQAEGSIYQYQGVPPFVFDLLEKGKIGPKTSGKNRFHEWQKGLAPSLGGTLNALLKAGNFSYRKVA